MAVRLLSAEIVIFNAQNRGTARPNEMRIRRRHYYHVIEASLRHNGSNEASEISPSSSCKRRAGAYRIKIR